MYALFLNNSRTEMRTFIGWPEVCVRKQKLLTTVKTNINHRPSGTTLTITTITITIDFLAMSTVEQQYKTIIKTKNIWKMFRK